jgi:predicted O-methyltransferase YrrM
METIDLVKRAIDFGAVQVPEEISGLVELLKTRPLKNIMEIGSEAGGTFYLWCRLTALGGLKISLDLPSGASGSGRFTGKEAHAKRSALFKSWSANVHVVTGDSHEQRARCEVADILAGEKLDFLFIDGDHSREGVMLDYHDYRGFVRPGGLVAFHDIVDSEFHRKRGCFVADFWKELQGDKQEFNAHREWGGIGVVSL